MARSVNTIAATMFAAKDAEAALNGLTSNSQTAIWRLYIFIVAACINVFEQLMDLFKVELETIAANAIPGTEPWVKDRTLSFQYDATNPQVIQLVDLVPKYPVIDPALRIITRCSVVTNENKVVLIKVARSEPPQALSGLQKSSLEGYWKADRMGFAGIQYLILSESPDLIEIAGTVFFQGQYSAVIQANVEAALALYLKNLPFNGIVTVQAVTDAIQAVTGVTDVALTAINVRRATVTYASTTKLYNLADGINGVSYQTYAGYIVEETETAHTFADTLIYSPTS